jgi:hypothetical protein
VIAPYFDQNYAGFMRGDVDVNWHSPDSGLFKMSFVGQPALFQVAVSGDEIMLPINYNLEIPLISFDLDIAYNQQAMKFERIETTNLTADFQVAYNKEFNNRLKIGAFSHNPIATSGTLLFIVFKTTDPNKANAPINISRFLVNNFCLTATTVNVSTDDQSTGPDKFELYQNYPNPFNGETTISFYSPTSGNIKLVIYNLLGEELTTLFNSVALPGKCRLTWNGKDKAGNGLASGIYICKVFHALGNETIKIIYLE